MTNPDDGVIAGFRANTGSVTQAMGGGLAHLDLVLLHHLGRCSGQPYLTPLAYTAYQDDYPLLGSSGGAATEPQWVKNARNATELTVEVGTGIRTATIPTVRRDGPQRERLYDADSEHWPFVLDYEQQTSRPFPLVRLTPIDRHRPSPPPLP
jgi:deazaflavin-dependent oxidoreductase (nitroreductase family)